MKPSFRHALVALDLSDASDIIIDCLPHFHRFGTNKVTLFTSVPVSYPGGLSQSTEKQYENKLEDFRKTLEQRLSGSEKSGSGISMQVETLAGFEINAYPPSAILETARERQADYIIIANRGQSKYRDLLLGSTATELLQRSDLPVYLINLSISDAEVSEEMEGSQEKSRLHLYCVRSCRDSLQHILYPTDFSDTADRAFEALRTLIAGQPNNSVKRITLYHVQEKGRIGMDDPGKLAEFNEIDRQRLESLKERLEKLSGAEFDIDIGTGSAALEIIEKAASSDASMIIMGGQGRGFLHELFLGGVTHQVVRKSVIPVLVVPAEITD